MNCSVYVDVRTPPGMRPLEAMREFRTAVGGSGIGATVEFFLSQQGYVAQGWSRWCRR